MKDIVYRRADRRLSDGQLKEIAGLIYDSDPYIYPAMFASREDAEAVLPKMIRAGDPMFGQENLFTAMEGRQVAGVLVWTRGPLFWNKKIYEKCGGASAHIDRVMAEYFSLFAETPPDTASLIRLSVRPDRQGQGIGSRLTDTFFEEEKGPYQLYALSGNTEAIPFFQGKGFRIRETRPGFSLDYRALPCYWMVKGC